jgi:VanZ family protein
LDLAYESRAGLQLGARTTRRGARAHRAGSSAKRSSRGRLTCSHLQTFSAQWLPLVLWAALTLALGSSTIFPDNHELPRLLVRKAAHLALYAVLALLLYRALGSVRGLSVPSRLALVLAVVATMGCVDEWHQGFVRSRSARVGDVWIDALGGAVGLVAARAIEALRERAAWQSSV